jgi:hypothetical protein
MWETRQPKSLLSSSRFLRYSIDGDKIRDQDTVTVVGYVARNAVGRDLAWKFLKENWSIFLKRYSLRKYKVE